MFTMLLMELFELLSRADDYVARIGGVTQKYYDVHHHFRSIITYEAETWFTKTSQVRTRKILQVL